MKNVVMKKPEEEKPVPPAPTPDEEVKPI